MAKEVQQKSGRIYLNGDTKWVVTLVVTIIVASIAYGQQLKAIDVLAADVLTKADKAYVEMLKENMIEIKDTQHIIQTDIKELLKRSKKD